MPGSPDLPLRGPLGPSTIEVRRDGYGIPHCYAGSEADAFFAQGWVHAADRLWQMEYDRRRGQGRWAEVVGQRGVAIDSFYRRVDLSTFVRRDIEGLTPRTRAMLDAYASGVNAFIDQGGSLTREFEVAGVEPQRWEPWHSLLVFRVRHILMGSARYKIWRAVAAGVVGEATARTMAAGWGDDDIACVPPGAPCEGDRTSGIGDLDGGSNNWVLAGSRTASGLPLLAGDPHRELEVPNVYVQGHLSCPEWDVLGIGMAGVPGFPHFGHNARVAWSITHAMADDQDLFELAAGAPATRRTETISVRDGDPVEVDVTMTEHGPLIADRLALCWTATAAPNHGFDAIAAMVDAHSVDELLEAMRPWVEPANSLLAADVDGHIGYLTRGRLPVRATSDAPFGPVDASDPASAWRGWVPFEDLPRCVDPDTGFLFSANNRIAAAADAPYIGLDAAAPGRARRIVARLSTTTGATVADMEELHADVVSLPAQRLVAGALRDWAAVAGWDGAMHGGSTEAAAYSRFRVALTDVVMERSGLAAITSSAGNRILPGVTTEAAMWRVAAQHLEAGDTSLLNGWSWDEAVAEAINRAEKAAAGRTWGEDHAPLLRHPLGVDDFNPPTVAYGGDMDTVQAATYIPSVSGLAMRSGSVARYAFDVADWDRSGWVVPLGSAGEPGAAHAHDQQEAWSQCRLVAAPYSRGAVGAATESVRTLTR